MKRVGSGPAYYVLYRNSMIMGPNNWYIAYWNGSDSSMCWFRQNVKFYYGSPNKAYTPPTNGWVVLNGHNPAPKLCLLTAQIKVNTEEAWEETDDEDESKFTTWDSSNEESTKVPKSICGVKAQVATLMFTLMGAFYCFRTTAISST